MNDDVRNAVQQQLDNARDNLHRARSMWRGLAPDDMSRQYGESGRSREELLTAYQADVTRWEAALASLG